MIVFLGALGAVALLGFLSLAVILAQVIALVLLGLAPIALVIGIFPGSGHAFFRSWLAKLATAVFIKALYSLVIALVVAVSAALTAATDSLGFLFAFGLQTLFFWALFVYRRQITSRLVTATTGGGDARMPRMTVVQKGAHAAARPFSALVGVPRGGGDGGRQESALAGGAGWRRAGTAPSRPGAAPRPGRPPPPPVGAPSNGPRRSRPANGALQRRRARRRRSNGATSTAAAHRRHAGASRRRRRDRAPRRRAAAPRTRPPPTGTRHPPTPARTRWRPRPSAPRRTSRRARRTRTSCAGPACSARRTPGPEDRRA